MASVNSDTYTAQLVDPAQGVFSHSMVTYTALVSIAGDFDASGDTANLFTVPKGLVPIPHASRIVCEALGTTCTLDIGTADDADAYADGVSGTAAASLIFSGGVQALAPVATTEQTTIIATLATAATMTAGAKLRVNMVFARV